MFGRIITLAAGIGGAAAVSQFPEFSQQYLQRLAGQAETIETFVADFDEDAARVGLTREELLTEFEDRPTTAPRAETMERYIRLEQVLGAQLATLREGTALERLMAAPDVMDRQTVRGTLDDYRPALPLTLEGALFALVGFIAAVAAVGLLWRVIAWPFRQAARRQRGSAAADGPKDIAADKNDTPPIAGASNASPTPHSAPAPIQSLPNPEVAFAGSITGLRGTILPNLSLPDTEGTVLPLSALQDGTLLFTYPLMAQPGQSYPGGWGAVQGASGSTSLALALRDGRDALARAGINTVIGVSTQPTLAQAKVRHALNLPFILLSDGRMRLAQALDLPRFTLHGQTHYRQTVLIIEGGRIAHTLHPISDHEGVVEDILAILRSPNQASA
ncbi:MAG: DUF2937 family protein [Shimia sp.]